MKDYEGLKRTFIMIIAYILMSYIGFMNGEGLTSEFIDIETNKAQQEIIIMDNV